MRSHNPDSGQARRMVQFHFVPLVSHDKITDPEWTGITPGVRFGVVLSNFTAEKLGSRPRLI